MKIVCISDTHTLQHLMVHDIPDGDVLVHAGDICSRGLPQEIYDTNLWFGELKDKFEHIIFVPGNHDIPFEKMFNLAKQTLSNATVLCDQELVIDGVKFYGSPWQPEFCNWAFNLPRGEGLARKWSFIPNDTDILITHGPPLGFQDQVIGGIVAGEEELGGHVGCEDLREAVLNRVKPKYHIFGHIHEAYGMTEYDGITFINATTCNVQYQPVNEPWVIEI